MWSSLSFEEKIANIKASFLIRIELHRKSLSYEFGKTETLLEYSYHFCRLSNLFPDLLKLSYEEKENFCKYFPSATKMVVEHITKVYDTIEPDRLNKLKGYRSALRFYRTNVYKIYKDFENNRIPEELQISIGNLDWADEIISGIIKGWEHFGDGVDRDYDVPNLNGVPKYHNWWKEKHRMQWQSNKDVIETDALFVSLMGPILNFNWD